MLGYSNGTAFVVEDFKHRIEFRDSEKLLDALDRAQQDHPALGSSDGSPDGNQFPQAVTVNVSDGCKIQHKAPAPLLQEGPDPFTQSVFKDTEPARQIENHGIRNTPRCHFESHNASIKQRWLTTLKARDEPLLESTRWPMSMLKSLIQKGRRNGRAWTQTIGTIQTVNSLSDWIASSWKRVTHTLQTCAAIRICYSLTKQTAMNLLSLAPLAVLLLQVALGPAPQQRPQGSIEGTVTRQGSAQPVPAAQVRLTRRGGPGQTPGPAVAVQPGGQIVPPPGQPNAAGARGAPAPIAPVVTDDRGRFSFPGLEEGTYILQVAANGYVIQPYGQRFPNGPGTPIPLTSGQAIRDIQINLMPAANISGRVRDTSDQSLINVPVQLLRYSYNSTGQRTYQSVGTTQTNDRGEYRMYWVTPGRYYLVAGRSTTGASPLTEMMMASVGGLRPNGNAVPPVSGYVFYPGVTEIANARVIDLQPGADLQAVDLVLANKPRTYSIRGKLIDSRTGQPPPRATVFVATQTPGLSGNGANELLGPNGPPSRNYNATSGTFEIRELLPGTYNVIATVQDAAIAGRGGPVGISSGMMPTSISSSDVDGLVLSVVPAGASRAGFALKVNFNKV